MCRTMLQQNNQPQNNVIGPIPANAWRTLRMLREDISWMESLNQTGTYLEGINKEKEVYSEVLRRYVKVS